MSATIILSLAIWANLANSNQWVAVEEQDGLKVWYRDVPNHNIREIKAQAVVPAPANQVWATLADVDHYVEFMPYMVEAKIVGKHPNGHYEYQLLDPPLVSRRDYTVKVDLLVDETKGEYVREWVIANEHGPELNPKAVRITDTHGSWKIMAKGPNSSEVIYHVYSDPGGSIPTWIANRANTVALPDLFNALKHRSLDPSWKR